MDHKLSGYLLASDYQIEKNTKIHSVLSVSASSDVSDEFTVFEPYFSFTHQMERRNQTTFYHLMHRSSDTSEIPGTRMFLSNVDSDFRVTEPAVSSVFAHTPCTNQRQAEEIPAGAVLKVETPAPVSRIFAVIKPTPQIEPPLKGAAM